LNKGIKGGMMIKKNQAVDFIGSAPYTDEVK
jgi:hypothetical protein